MSQIGLLTLVEELHLGKGFGRGDKAVQPGKAMRFSFKSNNQKQTMPSFSLFIGWKKNRHDFIKRQCAKQYILTS